MRKVSRFLLFLFLGALLWGSGHALSVTAATPKAPPSPSLPITLVTQQTDGSIVAQPQVMAVDAISVASAPMSDAAPAFVDVCTPNTIFGLPTLLNPADGAATTTLIPELSWQHDANDTRVIYYNIQIAQDSAFTQLLRDVWRPTANLPTNAVVVDTPFNNLAPATTYYWRVVNICRISGNLGSGASSVVRSFQTGSGGTLLPAPTQTSPADGALIGATSVTVEYSAVPNATQYQVRFYRASSDWTGNWFSSYSLNATAVTATGFNIGETIYWRVAARNSYGWGAPSAERSFTIIDNTASITIIKDAVPNSATNFRFSSGLGPFYLDDSVPQDGDGYSSSKSFIVTPGVYNFTELVPDKWVLAGIGCTPATNGNVKLNLNRVTVTLTAGTNIICRFTNHYKATFKTLVYFDMNGNRIYDSNEPGLSGWTITIYDEENNPLFTAITDDEGKADFTRKLVPGVTYKICEDVALGWTQSVPARLDPVLGKPCYTRTPTPGQTLTLRFGNTLPIVTAAAEEIADTSEDVTVEELVTAPDESGYDAGYVETEEEAFTPTQSIFLPLILDDTP